MGELVTVRWGFSKCILSLARMVFIIPWIIPACSKLARLRYKVDLTMLPEVIKETPLKKIKCKTLNLLFLNDILVV